MTLSLKRSSPSSSSSSGSCSASFGMMLGSTDALTTSKLATGFAAMLHRRRTPAWRFSFQRTRDAPTVNKLMVEQTHRSERFPPLRCVRDRTTDPSTRTAVAHRNRDATTRIRLDSKTKDTSPTLHKIGGHVVPPWRPPLHDSDIKGRKKHHPHRRRCWCGCERGGNVETDGCRR
ncbi:hypothetical protein RIF29_33239 [Crotalaria pallida]|uniref:Uncharacterized protein n=1 Tax=Crotalaria pallida TaxID=3830 RepID=A0AAN9E9T6_CROPI